MHPITGISFPSADVNSSPLGLFQFVWNMPLQHFFVYIKEIDDPESTNMSTFWSENPRVSAALDLTAVTTTLPIAEGFTASWGIPSLF